MKIFICLMFVAVLNVNASSYAQNKKISLNLVNSSLTDVFNEIEKQSNFTIFYKLDDIDFRKVINVRAKNKLIDGILNEVLKDCNLTYTVNDNVIVVLSKAKLKTTTSLLQKNVSTVKGKVTDLNNQPIQGVSVLIKGTSQGTVTDLDGNYSILNVPDKARLVFSFIGMKTQEVLVSRREVINIELQDAIVGLNEVVAVGYGTTTKEKLVSSLSSVDTKGLSNAPYTSAVNGLAGRASGLFVQESGGQYGSLPTLSIRGAGEPAIVIDGILSSKDVFAMLPPSDIEDVSVLKDASAAAVYGFNSANGVILVTTKRAGKGVMKIELNSDFSFQTNPLRPKFMTSYEKALFDNQAAFNDGISQIVSDETLNILKNNLDPVKYPNNVPYDQMVKKIAAQQRQTLTISGSKDNTDTYVSFDYFNQDAIYKLGNNGLDRYSLRYNTSHKFEKIGLTASAGVNLSRQKSNYPPADQWLLWITALRAPSGTPLFNPAGNYYGERNPLAITDPAAGYSKYETNRGIADLTLKWDVPWIKGLSFKAVGSYEMDQWFNKLWSTSFRSAAPIYSWDNTPSDMGLPSLNENMSRYNKYTLEGHVNYLRTFAQSHTLELTGVVIRSEDRNDYFSATRRDFISPAVDQLFAGNPDSQLADGNASESGRLGYVGRVKYDYKSKYILEGSCRYDGNDNFPKDKRYGFFPSVSFGWNMANEELFKPWFDKISLSGLKLRASWGNLGSDAGVSRFGYISNYNLANSDYYIDGKWMGSFYEGPLVSQDLSWYKVESKNLGFDFAFLKNKFSGTFDWFYTRTTGFIGSPQETYTTPLGKDLPQINTNSAFRRGGFEASMLYHVDIDGVKINIGGNISYYDQLWESKYDESIVDLKNPYTRITHQTDYYTNGLQNLGYFQSVEDIINSPLPLGSTQTMCGDLKYQDLNGDGKIDSNDNKRIGKSNFPHITYGGNLNISYKGITLDVLIQGTGNRQMYMPSTGMWDDGTNAIPYTIMQNYWRPDNTNALFPRQSTSLSSVNGSNNTQTSSFWLKDAWYVRLKSLSLSYDLKHMLLKNAGFINNCSVILSGTNLFTVSPVTKYFMDPEISDFGSAAYPVPRTFNIGLRFAF
ncbi:MAG: TonB-dependent receptor [Bacteroidota bacterium]|nr:TonB-dependent receptor [Bacteroidota bacterium]